MTSLEIEKRYTSVQVCDLAAVTYRQLDYWVRTGRVEASVNPAAHSGDQRQFSFRDLLRVAIAAELIHAGMTVPTAFDICTDLMLHDRLNPLPVTSYVAVRMDVTAIRDSLIARQPVRRRR